jgi:hypothetical protein
LEEGRAVVRNVEQVRPGDRLVTLVQHGQIISRVEEAGPLPNVMDDRVARGPTHE